MINVLKRRKRIRTMNIRQQILAIGIGFLAIMFLCALLYNEYIYSLNKQTNRLQNSQEISRMSTVLSSHVEHIMTILNLVTTDNDAATIASLDRQGDHTIALPYVKTMIDKLSLLASANRDINAIDLIIPDGNRVISDIGQYSLDYFNTRVVSDQLRELAASGERIPLTILSGKAASTYSTLNPFFAVQIHAYARTKYSFAVAIVSQENINNTIARQFHGKKLSAYALTQNADLYCWYDSLGGNLSGEEVLDIYNSGKDTCKRNGGTLDILCAQVGTLRLVMLFPRNEVESAFARSWALLGIMALVFLLVAGFLYRLMIRWFYRPMNNLLTSFALRNSEPSQGNEYMRIQGAMNSMRTSIASLEERMGTEETQFRAGARNWMSAIATGASSDLVASRYIFVALVIEDAQGASLSEKCHLLFNTLERQYKMNLVIDSIDIHKGIIVLGEDGIDADIFRDALAGVLSNGDFARIGISQIHTGSEELSAAYDESQAALGGIEGQQVCTYGEIPAMPMRFRVMFMQQTALANHLAAGDMDAVRETLEKVYQANAEIPLLQQCRLSMYLLDLLMVLISGNNMASVEQIDPDEVWLHSRNPMLLKTRVLERYARLCGVLRPDDMGEALRRYVDDHISDVNLTLSSVAEQVNRSYSYVSSAFGKACGVSFSTYLQKRRVTAAMCLLAETDDNVAAISAKVGYEAASSFIRVFKKETGLTPGQYRDVIRASGGMKEEQ